LLQHNGILLQHNEVLLQHNEVLLQHNEVLLQHNEVFSEHKRAKIQGKSRIVHVLGLGALCCNVMTPPAGLPKHVDSEGDRFMWICLGHQISQCLGLLPCMFYTSL